MIYLYANRKDHWRAVIDQEQWIESAEQKPLRSVGEDLAFPGGRTLPPFGWRENQRRDGEGAVRGPSGVLPVQAEATPSWGRALGSELDTNRSLQGLRLHQKIVLHFSEHLTALLSSTEERADFFAGGTESSVKVIWASY